MSDLSCSFILRKFELLELILLQKLKIFCFCLRKFRFMSMKNDKESANYLTLILLNLIKIDSP
ncbi:hypothetical protein BpHYR1_016401 [Brachionus plicatilis]|uniref:Uncharacterized protein n=1 Tax=Brachionus plicatilis TaxID=10195 RepID=A0A3M7SWY0_BRAPC|nr:hypothetical protein BpHYR1_016401 [Brachionus plicatilis]